MVIKADMTLSKLQEAFTEIFPGLKIVFYSHPHQDHEGSSRQFELDATLKVGNIQDTKREGKILLDPERTVAELEADFERNFGLHAQVFRRSNTLWLQTVRTDGWTLEKQNLKGLHSIQSKV